MTTQGIDPRNLAHVIMSTLISGTKLFKSGPIWSRHPRNATMFTKSEALHWIETHDNEHRNNWEVIELSKAIAMYANQPE